MIWNYIFEFLVKYIFGGVLYDDNLGVLFYKGSLGMSYIDEYNYNLDTSSNLGIKIFNNYSMPLGNYLSLITTIIIMALIVWFAVWLTIWVFKMVAHAFLLK